MLSFDSIEALAICVGVLSIILPCNGQQDPGTISDTRVCRRWRHSSVISEKSLYIYGGNAWRQESEIGTRSSTTNRDFLYLDLSNDFDLADPPFIGLAILPTPGPAKVLQASFWVNEAESKLTLYGGSFGQTDIVEDFSLWSYNPPTAQWEEEVAGGDPVLRASNGASAYYKGVGYYRGGQLDNLTNPNWPDGDGGRVILSGMLKVNLETSLFINETRAPGFDVFEFQDPKNTGFQYRDGNLVPITFNKRDYLINLSGGGPRGHALPLDNVYIYDIEQGTWYRQPVSGTAPINTRGACTVANYAPDNSSIQITLFGGLIYNQDIQDFEATSDIWMLTIPSFTWIPMNTTNAYKGPGGRQEHTCHIVGSQMVVLGGRNASNICEGSGVWVLDTAKSEWQSSFTATSTYTVPTLVSSIIGGNSNGGASWNNLPVISPPDTKSPFYDINGSKTAAKKSPSAGVIAGSVIGGLISISIAGYVAWYFYRRHQRQKLNETPVPPPVNVEELDPTKGVSTYAEAPQEISELAGPTPSPQAPRYSTLSGYEPAQLHGDTSFPAELYSPPLGQELPPGPSGVYEAQTRERLGNNLTIADERDPITHETLQEVPVPPPAERS